MTPSPEWRVSLTRTAEKGLRKLSANEISAVGAAIEKLPDGDTRKLRGYVDMFRLRVGAIRVVFHIERDARQIEVRDVFSRGRGY